MLSRFSVASFAALVAFTLALAQAPLAPAQMIVIAGSGNGGGGGGGGGGDPYDLSGFGIDFAYDWPTAPVTTTTVEVDTCAEWQAAANDTATLVNVAAGSYGACDITVTGSDLDFVISTSATIDGGALLFRDLDDVRWTGGNLVDGDLAGHRFTDLLIDNFCVNNFAENSDEINNFVDDNSTATNGAWSRFAIINSTFALYGNTGTAGSWAFYVNPDGFPAGPTTGNLILANFKVLSTGQNNRFMAADNTVIVDSVFNPDGVSANGMRIHQESTNVYMADSWIRGIFKLDGTGAQVVNAEFDNVDQYDQTSGWSVQAGADNTGTVLNSTLYNASGGSWSAVHPSDFTDGGGNTWAAWDGTTVPDHSAVGADRCL
jgi:hypothetical protein